jgi:hypothetical protein
VQADVVLELTLMDDAAIDPMLDRRLAPPLRPGLQRISLSDYGVRLRPGRVYQWSVALVPDPGDHAKDVVASGWIELVPEPDGLAGRLASAEPERAVTIYGAAGIWYEMVDAAYDAIDRHPDDPRYRAQLASLLEQSGLPGAAAGP